MEAKISAFKGALESVTEGLPQARYNQNILSFLCQEMEKVEVLLAQMPASAPLDELQILISEAQRASKLVAGHARRFDLRNYYGVDYVHHEVKQLCELMKEVMRECLSSLGLKDSTLKVMRDMDADIVEKDRRYMHWYLTCILEGKLSGRAIPESIRRELEAEISKYRERMKFVNLICDGDIAWLELIGSGGCGEVHKGLWNGQLVAVKKLNGDLSPEAQAEFFSEVQLHIELSHPNVVRCFGAATANTIVMELAWSDLEQFCWQFVEDLTWLRRLQLMDSACSGLRHLHSRNIIHRDVKTSNFLVFRSACSAGVTVKICDFGLAATKHETRTRSFVGPIMGTLRWMAPEVCEGHAHTFSSDVFAFGLVLFAIAALDAPYRGWHGDQLVLLRKKTGKCPGLIPEDCPGALAALVERCIASAPQERPTIEEVSMKLAEILEEVKSGGKAEDMIRLSLDSTESLVVELEAERRASRVENRQRGLAPYQGVDMDRAPSQNGGEGWVEIPPHVCNVPGSPKWKCSKVLKGHDLRVTSLVVVGDWLMSGSADGTIRTCSLATWELTKVLEWRYGMGVHCMAANNGLLFASAPYQTIWVLKLGSWVCTDGLSMHNGEIKSLALTKDWLFASSGKDGICVWRLGTLVREVELRGHKAPVRALLANDEFLFSGSRDHTVRVWGIGGSWDCEHVLKGHSDRVAALATSGGYLASGSWDGTVCVWSMSTWDLVKRLGGHTDGVTCLAAKCGLLFSGSKDCSVRVWRVGTWSCTHVLWGHSMPVYGLALGKCRLFSCGGDKTVRVWDEETAFFDS